jgi:hypothetical protein
MGRYRSVLAVLVSIYSIGQCIQYIQNVPRELGLLIIDHWSLRCPPLPPCEQKRFSPQRCDYSDWSVFSVLVSISSIGQYIQYLSPGARIIVHCSLITAFRLQSAYVLFQCLPHG